MKNEKIVSEILDMKKSSRMSNNEEIVDEIIDDQDYLDDFDDNEEEEGKKRGGSLQVFAISTIVHLFIIFVLTLMYWSYPDKEDDVIITTSPIAMEEEEEEEVEREIVKQVVEVVSDVVTEITPIVTTEQVIEEMQTENEMDAETAEGVSEAISDMPLVGSGIMGNIGGGGGGGGAFGTRSGGGKRKAVMKGGGSKKTESAVDAALKWLKRHQEKDGSWDSNKYGNNRKNWGENESVSGLAVLAFLSAGHTPKIGKFRKTVAKGIAWIISKQNADGSWGNAGTGNDHEIYDAAICTLALAECYGMFPDKKIKVAAQKGLDYLLNPVAGRVHFGYKNNAAQSISVTGWIVMALKSSKIAGLKIPKDAFEPYKNRIKEMTDDDNGYKGVVHYLAKGDRNESDTTMTAVGMLCNLYLGVHRSDLSKQAEIIMKNLPNWKRATKSKGIRKGPLQHENNDFYHWYYGTLAMFQYGGKAWKEWNKGLMGALLPSQRKGGPKDGSLNDTDGSWDPVTRWGGAKGRVYTTAMGAFCFEVYYRYKSVTH